MNAALPLVTESLLVTKAMPAIVAAVLMALSRAAGGAEPVAPNVDLRECVKPSPVKNADSGSVAISGAVKGADGAMVRVRVTTGLGASFEAKVPTEEHHFSLRFPQDFAGAGPLSPMLLYVDATDAPAFGGPGMLEHQAEVLLIVADGGRHARPDLPAPFTDDLIDAGGRKDAEAAQWPQQRALVNLFMESRGAKLARVGRADFDLARPPDFAWFKEHATLYDFDHRDRDWAQPLGHRVARGFWQAVWNAWFGPSNDQPWDGNQANRDSKNYRPYTFTNDLADILVLQQMRRSLPRVFADHRDDLCREALANLLAMQQRGADNFALPEAGENQERYTAGAFHYGMFNSGEWMTEGNGWFADPRHGDFRRGGVFNGRAVWALGESLKAEPDGKLAAQTREAIELAMRFCLHDALPRGYAREVKPGFVFWRDAGEHGYLLLGMLAACEVAPEMPVRLTEGGPAKPLRDVCADALDALVAAVKPSRVWTPYPDQDAMAIAALATGARVLGQHPHRGQWLATAVAAADDWMSAQADPAERKEPTPHFGFRKGAGMTHFMGADHRVRFTFYVTGHWIHALAKLHALTGDPRYLARCQEMLGYLCGDNPFHARLLNELGSVYNYTLDTDGDGMEDTLQWDAYPESTAFVQIGLLHFLKSSFNHPP